MSKKSPYDLTEWSKSMAQPKNQTQDLHPNDDNQEVFGIDDVRDPEPDDVPSVPQGYPVENTFESAEDRTMEDSFPTTAKEVEALVAKKAKEYKDRHYPNVDPQRVRWNKDGVDEIVEIIRRAVRQIPNVSKKSMADAAGITYITISKWLDEAGGNVKKKTPIKKAPPIKAPEPKTMAAQERKKSPGRPVRTPVSEPSLCFDIERLDNGRLRVYLDPRQLKSFIAHV